MSSVSRRAQPEPNALPALGECESEVTLSGGDVLHQHLGRDDGAPRVRQFLDQLLGDLALLGFVGVLGVDEDVGVDEGALAHSD